MNLHKLLGAESATNPTVAGGTMAIDNAGVAAKAEVIADSSKSLKFQIGANENQSLTLDIADMRASALGITTSGTSDKLAVTDGTNW